jgi:citrate lyase beta subunit
VSAFEKARAAGKDRAKVDGALIEVPIYAAAKRLLESAARS